PVAVAVQPRVPPHPRRGADGVSRKTPRRQPGRLRSRARVCGLTRNVLNAAPAPSSQNFPPPPMNLVPLLLVAGLALGFSCAIFFVRERIHPRARQPVR